jgi:hypothetical protein
VQRQRLREALDPALALVLYHLPMPRRHAVLAHEQRLPVGDADAPVERRRQPFLRDHDLRAREERMSTRGLPNQDGSKTVRF